MSNDVLVESRMSLDKSFVWARTPTGSTLGVVLFGVCWGREFVCVTYRVRGNDDGGPAHMRGTLSYISADAKAIMTTWDHPALPECDILAFIAETMMKEG